jgi:cytochrome c-type biogenesis protein
MNALLLPIALGLLGFVEPCTMGSNLILIKHLERLSYRQRLLQMWVFAAVRALMMGVLGALAALVGMRFFGVQRGLWIGLGVIYLALGLLYLAGRQGWLVARLSAWLPAATGTRGSAALGLIFGLNVPACAVPLIVVLLGVNASQAAGGHAPLQGFVSLLLFGLALSAPLLLAVLWQRAGRVLDTLASLSARIPRWTGLVLVALGLWSIGSGWFAHVPLAP